MIEEELRVTAPIDHLQLPPGIWPKQGEWTTTDWARLPGDGNRYELIDRVLHVTSAPSLFHQWTSDSLISLLRPFLQRSSRIEIITGNRIEGVPTW